MKKKHLLISLHLFFISIGFTQIPVETYRAEIETLETVDQVNGYWNQLYEIDQNVLLSSDNVRTADSISISNMIKTYLVFDIHGTKGYNPNGFSGFLPILNLAHNYIGQSQLAYWPIIEKCEEIGGAIDSFGGKYPAYQLENISLTFYNYSLINQEYLYPKLLPKLSTKKTTNIIDELLSSFNHQNELRKLIEVDVLHNWYLESIKNRKEDGKFSIVKMSDNNLYLKRHGRIQKLQLLSDTKESKHYRIENAPFGWLYSYKDDGSLSLIDDEQNELIKYTLIE